MSNNPSCIRVFADRNQINACRNSIRHHAVSFNRLSRVLALTGNEVRLKILFLLKTEGELCPCDLSDILGMSIPAISQHLRKMKDGGLVKMRRTGQTLLYTLTAEHMDVLNPIFYVIDNQNKKEETA